MDALNPGCGVGWYAKLIHPVYVVRLVRLLKVQTALDLVNPKGRIGLNTSLGIIYANKGLYKGGPVGP